MPDDLNPDDLNPDDLNIDGKLWQSAPEWRDNRIFSQAKSELWLIWFFAVVFCGSGILLAVFVFPEELRKENYLILLALVFPLVGLGMLGSAVRKTLEWRRFRRLELVLDPFPGSLGGDIGGTLDLPLRYRPGFLFKLNLACCRVYLKSTSDGTETREDVIWDRQGLAETKATLDGTRLAFRFAVPGDLAESEAKSDDYKRWSLHIHGALPGADLDRLYIIPVFRTGGQKTRQRIPESHEGLVGAPPSSLPANLVRLQRDAYGIELYYPALRNLSATLLFGLLSAVFVGASIFLTSAIRWSAMDDSLLWFLFENLFGLIPLIMSVVFWGVALAMTLGTLYMLGNSLRVRVTGEEIVSRRRVFGIPLQTRRIASDQVRTLAVEAPMRHGPATRSTKFQSLIAKGPGREKVSVAEGIRDPAILAELRRIVVHAGRLKLAESK